MSFPNKYFHKLEYIPKLIILHIKPLKKKISFYKIISTVTQCYSFM